MEYIDVLGIRVDSKMFTTKFVCDYEKCKGACCWEESGFDTGGLLLYKEHKELLSKKEELKPYINKELKESHEQTPFLKSGKDYFTNTYKSHCIYSSAERKTCILKLAHKDGVINFDIPMHCGTYPAELFRRNGKQHIKVLDIWDEHCYPAYIKGEKENTPLFRFLKDKLVKLFSEEFYQALESKYKSL